jgi:hypothetical protein
LLKPARRQHKASREKIDVEHVPPIVFFFRREQIEKERGEARLPERRGDVIVAGTEPAAAAAMRENNDAQRALRNSEESVQALWLDPHFTGIS